MSLINRLISHTGVFLLSLLSLLPLRVLYVFADFIFYYIFRYRKKVVHENLAHAFPEKSKEELLAIEKKYFKYLSCLVVEIIKMPTISADELRERFKYTNKQVLNDLLNQGKSVLICAAHYGNWEWGSLSLGLNIRGLNYGIYKPLSNAIFDHWFHKIRTKFGNRMVAMRQTLRAINESKDEATTFSFANDQAPTKEDSLYWTNFLNQPSAIFLGIEKIAKRTNRPIVYLNIKLIKRGYYEVECTALCLHPKETKTYEITELHTRFLENIIREEPAYWLWSHKRWKRKMPIGQQLTQINGNN